MTDIEIVWRSSCKPGIQRRIVIRAEHWTLDEQTTALTAEGNVILRVQGAVIARGLERPDTLDAP